MAKQKQLYICNKCGSNFATWFGKCPQCGEWNTLELKSISPKTSSPSNQDQLFSPIPITQSFSQQEVYFSCGEKEVDLFLGGGLVKGGVYLLGGEPGIGKSTWLLQLAGLLASRGLKTLYLSGEESLLQVQSRGKRLGLASDNLYLFYSTKLEEALEVLETGFQIAVIDSVQTLTSSKLEGVAGTPSQIREVALELIGLAKAREITLFWWAM